MPNLPALIAVFEDVRTFLNLPDCQFMYSSWKNPADAVEEIDAILRELRTGTLRRSQTLHVLFAPTGPIQEASLDCDWGDEYLKLADRFDAAMDAQAPTCDCLTAPSKDLVTRNEFGFDASFAESSLQVCPLCGRLWLRISFENEGASNSGRWYLGCVDSESAKSLQAQNAKETFGNLDWYFCGGSYFDSQIGRTSGPIRL